MPTVCAKPSELLCYMYFKALLSIGALQSKGCLKIHFFGHIVLDTLMGRS